MNFASVSITIRTSTGFAIWAFIHCQSPPECPPRKSVCRHGDDRNGPGVLPLHGTDPFVASYPFIFGIITSIRIQRYSPKADAANALTALCPSSTVSTRIPLLPAEFWQSPCWSRCPLQAAGHGLRQSCICAPPGGSPPSFRSILIRPQATVPRWRTCLHELAFNIYAAAEHIDQLFYDRHTESGTFKLSSRIISILLNERLKYVLLKFFAHADTRICNLKAAEQRIACRIPPAIRTESYVPPSGEFNGVWDNIDQDLAAIRKDKRDILYVPVRDYLQITIDNRAFQHPPCTDLSSPEYPVGSCAIVILPLSMRLRSRISLIRVRRYPNCAESFSASKTRQDLPRFGSDTGHADDIPLSGVRISWLIWEKESGLGGIGVVRRLQRVFKRTAAGLQRVVVHAPKSPGIFPLEQDKTDKYKHHGGNVKSKRSMICKIVPQGIVAFCFKHIGVQKLVCVRWILAVRSPVQQPVQRHISIGINGYPELEVLAFSWCLYAVRLIFDHIYLCCDGVCIRAVSSPDLTASTQSPRRWHSRKSLYANCFLSAISLKIWSCPGTAAVFGMPVKF